MVTENVTKTVPVQREEVRVEREPITDANRGAAESGPEISEEEHEVVLHEERPVVEKEAVPVERVRLDTETVTDDVTVNEEVRKERVDTDVDEDLHQALSSTRVAGLTLLTVTRHSSCVRGAWCSGSIERCTWVSHRQQP